MAYTFNPFTGNLDYYDPNTGGGGSGDVVGPASSTDNAIARFDGATGKLIQNSTVTINDSGQIETAQGLNVPMGTNGRLLAGDVSGYPALGLFDDNADSEPSFALFSEPLATLLGLPSAALTIGAGGATSVDTAIVRSGIGEFEILGGGGSFATRGDLLARNVTVEDEAYSGPGWDGSLEVPTKNALRDKIQAMDLVAAVNTAHTTSDGSDHTFIDQDVTIGSAPSFVNTNMTGNVSVFTNDAGYITATLSQEEVEDYVGAMFSGNTETLITATYQDIDGTIDLVVDNNLANYDNTTSGFLTNINSENLTDLSDVTISTLGADELLFTQDGSTWINQTLAEAGIAETANGLNQFAATTSAQLAGVISDETGSGALVFANSPTLVTPALGTPSSGVLTNATGYPGDSSLVTTGALNSGSITSGFGSIDVGTDDITGGTINATGDTSAGDNAAMGYTATEGLILTGQGSTSDITVKNDADATVFTVPTGTTELSLENNEINTIDRVLIAGQTSEYTANPGAFISLEEDHTWNYTTDLMVLPAAVRFAGTHTLEKPGFVFGMGFLFDANATFINPSGEANGFGPFYTLASRNKFTADTQSITMGANVDVVSQSVFNTTNSGTLTVNEYTGHLFQNTVDSGATLTSRFGLVYSDATVNGTLTGQACIAVENISNASNNSDILLGTKTIPSGNFGVYQSHTKVNRWNGGQRFGYRAVSSATTLDSRDHLIKCTGTGTYTLTLPPAANGRIIGILKVASGGTVTVDGDGSENINGSANFTMTGTAYEPAYLFSDGSNWFRLI